MYLLISTYFSPTGKVAVIGPSLLRRPAVGFHPCPTCGRVEGCCPWAGGVGQLGPVGAGFSESEHPRLRIAMSLVSLQ